MKPGQDSQPSCKDEFDPNALTVQEAQARIDAAIRPMTGHERLALRETLGRVLAVPLIAPFDIPGAANSAMDGYALRAADLREGDTTLALRGESFAGRPVSQVLEAGTCMRIMTGALLPEGADTVIMQEETRRDGDQVVVMGAHRQHENVRMPGEDVRNGQVILSSGKTLNAADIGLMASMGLAEVDVSRVPRVAFFSTGDELQSVGKPLARGQLYDSNRYTVHALLRRLGVQPIDMGVVRDDFPSVRQALRDAAGCADLVLTSGGVSVGDADYVKQALSELGDMDFWRIAMKPGRPLAFGHIGQVPLFGLPGNPVSAMTTFMLFVRRAIACLQGARPQELMSMRAVTTSPLRKSPGRTDFQRGICERSADGHLTVKTTGMQGSHVLSSMSSANCFIVLARESGSVAAGTEVDIIPFEFVL